MRGVRPQSSVPWYPLRADQGIGLQKMVLGPFSAGAHPGRTVCGARRIRARCGPLRIDAEHPWCGGLLEGSSPQKSCRAVRRRERESTERGIRSI